MLKEIQSGIKVGTDGYKTTVKAPAWEKRAGHYCMLLDDKLRFDIIHNKLVMKLLESCPRPTQADLDGAMRTSATMSRSGRVSS